jgi:hypothetical protein
MNASIVFPPLVQLLTSVCFCLSVFFGGSGFDLTAIRPWEQAVINVLYVLVEEERMDTSHLFGGTRYVVAATA